jgi:hypothetical protein
LENHTCGAKSAFLRVVSQKKAQIFEGGLNPWDGVKPIDAVFALSNGPDCLMWWCKSLGINASQCLTRLVIAVKAAAQVPDCVGKGRCLPDHTKIRDIIPILDIRSCTFGWKCGSLSAVLLREKYNEKGFDYGSSFAPFERWRGERRPLQRWGRP